MSKLPDEQAMNAMNPPLASSGNHSDLQHAGQAPATIPQKRPIACDRCHSQKIKCSGEKPCSRCRKAGYSDQCRYADRDRRIRVSENYLERLIEDSRELHAQRTRKSQRHSHHETAGSALNVAPLGSSQLASQNDTGEASWFQVEDASILPIYTSEAACSAFATQLCQCLEGPDTHGKRHLPRWNYIDESILNHSLYADINWPSLVSAKLLVKTALGHINPGFHLALKRDTIDVLSSVYHNQSFNDPLLKCKYFTLFAIGQVYSTPQDLTNPSTIAGTTYFARSLSLLQVIPERPSMTHIESLLLLAYFCQFLNRFHSAYLLIGNALRVGLSAGLNYNMPKAHRISAKEREHRVRIWWSIYVFDRFWGSKSGFPVQIHDDDIHVDLPSVVVPESCNDQFPDGAYQIATIELARITGNTAKGIYGPVRSNESFLQREQKLLIQLKMWEESLPEHLKLHLGMANPKHVVLMHLQFSFIVILALRPVLLNLLSCHAKKRPAFSDDVTSVLLTLGEACIHAARHSLKLCQDEWTSGSLAVFGYAFPAFIFSSALVLIISSHLSIGSPNDLTCVETAMEMLRILKSSNNLAAKDLYEQLERVQQCVEHQPSTANAQQPTSNPPESIPEAWNPPRLEQLQPQPTDPLPPAAPFPAPSGFSTPDLSMSTGMALQSSLMEEFLTQPVSHLDSANLVELPIDFDVSFLWSGNASIPE